MIAKITKRITALVLCLLMVASVLTSVPMFTAAAAVATDPEPADAEGLETKKTITDNGDGTYTISLESWSTGEVSSVTSTTPCDIIFVIDQSGSMAWNMSGGSSTSASNPSRLTVLKGIMTEFMTNAVNSTKDSNGNVVAQHRVAVVGFTHEENSNTELLTGVTISGGNGVRHDKITEAQYRAALVDISTPAGVAGVTAAINALDDEGGTEPRYGLEMAANILKNAPSLGDENRKKIVIFLTDGEPDDIDDSLGFSDTENAVVNAYTIKNTYGADLYAIGIFKGANPNEICLPVDSRWQADHDTAERANRFMNLVSSNYKAANSMYIRKSGLFSQYCSAIPVARSTEDYYFASETQEGLQNIFDTISQLITTPTIELSAENTTVKDIVTPYFDLPENTSDIKVYTADFNGTDFEERVASSLTPTVSGNTVSVKGFDFDANCVTSEKKADNTYGKKLIVEFTITPKEGFLGGSNVPTNESGSGIMVKEDGKDVLIEDFVPEYPDGGNGVSVPLPETGDFTVTAKDKYVYLNGGLTTDDMLENASFTYGTQTIDISPANNYGLADWQNAYADIEIKTSDAMTDVTEDDIFSISVIVTDKGDAENAVEASAEKNVYVLMPTAAFEDDEVIYGEKAVISDNASVEWKYGEKTDTALKADDEDVIGTAPEIAFTYAPVNTADGAVTSDDTAAYFTPNGGGDFGIKVATAKIDETDIMNKINFAHTDCEDGEELPSGAQFIVHSEACVLTVTKKVVNSASSEDEAFIVKISDDAGSFSKTVVLKADESITIEGLPIGDYTVTEDTNWAWRYEASYEGFTNAASRTVSLTADSIDGSVTITNSKVINRWLDFCDSVDNFFKDLGGAD